MHTSPPWLPEAELPQLCTHAPSRSWLHERGSLTERLRQQWGDVAVHLLEEGHIAPLPHEVQRLGACRAWDAESENRPQRGQFLPDSQAHSAAMGPEGGEKWTAVAGLQPATPKPDRLLGARAAEDASAATRDQPASCGTTACAQEATLGLSAAPDDPQFSRVSLPCLAPRRLPAPSALAWVRCVLLVCQGRPRVYARTVIPDWSPHNPWAEVQRLGQQPLGELLFRLPDLQRSGFEWASGLDWPHAAHWQAWHPTDGVARRCVFERAQAPLLLTEVFLECVADKPGALHHTPLSANP